jgi:hypothetical protein
MWQDKEVHELHHHLNRLNCAENAHSKNAYTSRNRYASTAREVNQDLTYQILDRVDDLLEKGSLFHTCLKHPGGYDLNKRDGEIQQSLRLT